MSNTLNIIASWYQIMLSGLLVVFFTFLKLYQINFPELLLLLTGVLFTLGLILRFLNYGAEGKSDNGKNEAG